jgi:hypothetical protein
MSKIIRTLAFILVLGGLLAWGVSTMAKAPTPAATHVTVLHGQVMENGIPITRDQIRPVNH